MRTIPPTDKHTNWTIKHDFSNFLGERKMLYDIKESNISTYQPARVWVDFVLTKVDNVDSGHV